MENKGVIYILTNPSFKEYVKIGYADNVENRLRQLSKTIKLYNKNAKIYLQINGKQAEYLGGDGVYVKQPLEY